MKARWIGLSLVLASSALAVVPWRTARVATPPAPAPKLSLAAPAKASPKPAVKTTTDYAVPVLMYHRIDTLTEKEAHNALTRDLTVSPEDFETQVSYLASHGFQFLTASQVADAVEHGQPLPEKAVCITMDDGYRDNFDKAFPILEKYGARATIFIVTGNMGKPERLDWGVNRQMQNSGVEFDSHTVNHLDLTTLPKERLDYELTQSRSDILAQLNYDTKSIAYPSGEFNQRVIERAKLAGYSSGWNKGGGPVMPGANLMKLPRVRVNGTTTMAAFERKVWSGVEARAIENEHRERLAMRSGGSILHKKTQAA